MSDKYGHVVGEVDDIEHETLKWLNVLDALKDVDKRREEEREIQKKEENTNNGWIRSLQKAIIKVLLVN